MRARVYASMCVCACACVTRARVCALTKKLEKKNEQNRRHYVEEEAYPTTEHKTIKFSKKSHPECAAFSPDGFLLATVSIADHESSYVHY